MEAEEKRTANLRQRIVEEDNDFILCVVGEATKFQSLVKELLGHYQSGEVL